MLIENSYVSGASDAGIYVGQSEDIVVRRNAAVGNVAGIEIENSNRADVYENAVSKNTGGILVFDLPNLPKMGGGQVRVFKNAVAANDTPNFAPKGNIVASVRRGTGVLVMANDGVEITENALERERHRQRDDRQLSLPAERREVQSAAAQRAGRAQCPWPRRLRSAAARRRRNSPRRSAGRSRRCCGTGPARTSISSSADAKVLSLNLAAGAAPETAQPAPVDLSKGTPPPALEPVVLPRRDARPREVMLRVANRLALALAALGAAATLALAQPPAAVNDAAITGDALPAALSDYRFFTDLQDAHPRTRGCSVISSTPRCSPTMPRSSATSMFPPARPPPTTRSRRPATPGRRRDREDVRLSNRRAASARSRPASCSTARAAGSRCPMSGTPTSPMPC